MLGASPGFFLPHSLKIVPSHGPVAWPRFPSAVWETNLSQNAARTRLRPQDHLAPFTWRYPFCSRKAATKAVDFAVWRVLLLLLDGRRSSRALPARSREPSKPAAISTRVDMEAIVKGEMLHAGPRSNRPNIIQGSTDSFLSRQSDE